MCKSKLGLDLRLVTKYSRATSTSSGRTLYRMVNLDENPRRLGILKKTSATAFIISSRKKKSTARYALSEENDNNVYTPTEKLDMTCTTRFRMEFCGAKSVIEDIRHVLYFVR
ncbi:563_t:CDS:1 [Paraglomus occultum]|uniref:563_t:CDS:1 n=1 Tax=Paraglomus occultum TaxID=144539 RepID=A0A9N9GWH6_9GLOM|nr:563_t:CDS:1 [Paraglomus occultum]